MKPALPNVLVVYLAGLLQGLTLVSFPSSAPVLRSVHGLSDAQYGLIFLPQVAAAVIGAVGGGALSRRLGLQRLLWLAMLANGLSQLALASLEVLPQPLAFPMLMAATAFLGLGFGLLGAPMNAYPPVYFPKQANTSVVVMHTLLGVGLMLGPLAEGVLAEAGHWVLFPLLLLGLGLLLTLAAALLPLGEGGLDRSANAASSHGPSPVKAAAFWLFVLIAVIYAFAEGTFSNWAVVYLHEGKKLSPTTAAAALSAFWGALVGGRLLVSLLVLKLPAKGIWLLLPFLMIAAFLLLPLATTPALGIGLFGLSGLACSAFFPLSIALISARFPQQVAWVSAMLIAALNTGTGLGSFVVGALRSQLPFEQLYQWSALYPVTVLLLAIALARSGGFRDPSKA
jgi:fucose permease